MIVDADRVGGGSAAGAAGAAGASSAGGASSGKGVIASTHDMSPSSRERFLAELREERATAERGRGDAAELTRLRAQVPKKDMLRILHTCLRAQLDSELPSSRSNGVFQCSDGDGRLGRSH